MIRRLVIEWLKRREEDYDRNEKGRLCAPCLEFCGDDICKKVGCLNMDMRANSLRLKMLVKRLEDSGYEFPTSAYAWELSDEAIEAIKNTDVDNVVDLREWLNDKADYRTDDT